jgi:hypothetical protein
MIVEPGFLDHWKTKHLVRKLGTETAPFCVLRLWQHCQERKKDRFTGMDPDRLSAVCGWTGDAKVLWDAMLETYVDKLEDGTIVVHDWAAANAGLIAAWNNGRKGGRPKAQPSEDDVPPVPSPTPDAALEVPRPPQTEVELPPRFPRPEAEAVFAAATAGCPAAFAIETWNLAMSRNGRDSRGQAIASWPHYLKVQFQFNTNRKEESANTNRNSSGVRNGSNTSADRNRHIVGGSAIREQAKRSAEEQRKLAESGRSPFD